MSAFFGELEKIAGQQRSSGPWAAKTVGAPRSKMPEAQAAKAPTTPSKLNVKIVKPAAKFGPRQNYSQSNIATAPSSNPLQGAEARQTPPPNVVFGVR
jgi:hypothetical protein